MKYTACYIVTVLAAIQIAAWAMGKNGVITATITGAITLILGYLFGRRKGGAEPVEFPKTNTLKTA